MKNVKILLVFIPLFLSTLLSAQENTMTYEVVNVDYIDVRSQPNTSSGLLGRVRTGDVIVVENIVSGWAEISYKGKTAYVQSQNLKKIVTTSVSQKKDPQQPKVWANSAPVVIVEDTPSEKKVQPKVTSESEKYTKASPSLTNSRAGTSVSNFSLNYQHLFLEGEADYTGGFMLCIGGDYFITESFYANISLGYVFNIITSEESDFKVSTEIHDLRLPICAGIASNDSKFKFQTGPFVDFSVAGNNKFKYGSEESVTKLKDMDVKRFAFGWGVNVKLFNFLNLGYAVKLTDNIFGEGGDVHQITIGIEL